MAKGVADFGEDRSEDAVLQDVGDQQAKHRHVNSQSCSHPTAWIPISSSNVGGHVNVWNAALQDLGLCLHFIKIMYSSSLGKSCASPCLERPGWNPHFDYKLLTGGRVMIRGHDSGKGSHWIDTRTHYYLEDPWCCCCRESEFRILFLVCCPRTSCSAASWNNISKVWYSQIAMLANFLHDSEFPSVTWIWEKRATSIPSLPEDLAEAEHGWFGWQTWRNKSEDAVLQDVGAQKTICYIFT